MKRHRLRWLIISGIVVILVSILLLSGGYALAATSVDGFNDTLLAIWGLMVDLAKVGAEAILEAFGMILP